MTKTYAQCHYTHTHTYTDTHLLTCDAAGYATKNGTEKGKARFANDIKALHMYVTSHTDTPAHTHTHSAMLAATEKKRQEIGGERDRAMSKS